MKNETTVLSIGSTLHLQLQANRIATSAFKTYEMLNNISCLYVTNQKLGSSAYVRLLQGCIHSNSLSEGKLLHAHITQSGIRPEKYLLNTLLNLYAKCGCLTDACNVFDSVMDRDEFSWTVMITAYAKHGFFEKALALFYQMQDALISPSKYTFASVLRACANLRILELGRKIHEEIIRTGSDSDVYVGNALIDMYAKCGSIEDARTVFDEMCQRDVVSWNAMIAGYAQSGHVGVAMELFDEMPERDVVSWTAMIAAYAQNGEGKEALEIFRQMQAAGVEANSNTFASMIPACANLSVLELGKEVHGEIVRSGLEKNVYVGNALIDMYAKCGSVKDALNVFDKIPRQDVVSWTVMMAGYAQNGLFDEAVKLFWKMPQRNVVSWTAMIAGYAQNGHGEEALRLFWEMRLSSVKPNSKTFASVLPACAELADLEQGIWIHGEIIRNGFASEVIVANGLVDMYAKCGSLLKARHVFDKMSERDVFSWTAMIGGYAMHGCGKEALKLFEQMQELGMKPDHVTLLCVLSACCHAGFVEEGRKYFDHMSQKYNITPAMEHYGCIIDILGRAGHLDEAHDIIKKMPIKPNANVLGCLLGACRIHNNTELGELVAECILELDPKNAGAYVLLSNIYATARRWDDKEALRKTMKDRGVKARPGCSWIEVNKHVYAFLVGDGPFTERKILIAG